MLHQTLPAPDKRGGQNHISLMVPDMKIGLTTLDARRQPYPREFDAKTGVNGKRQANFF
jgi:hypothetical protein